MRAWSLQKFLNPASSNDDGWFKFSIRPNSDSRRRKGPARRHPSIQFIISDCSNKIYLEFEPETIYLDGDELISKTSKKRTLDSIKARRKKIHLFADSIETARWKIVEALDEFEDYVEGLDTNDSD